MHYRACTPADAAAVSAMIVHTWKHSYRKLVPVDFLGRLPDGQWIPTLSAWLDGFYGWMAEEDGVPVGCVIYGTGREDDLPGWGEILALYVHPRHMRRGIGRHLLQHALQDLRADGCPGACLWSIEGNEAAAAFYRSTGFTLSEGIVNYRIGGAPVTDRRFLCKF